MHSLTKLIRIFADRFMDYANIGFRYIDIPTYNTKLFYSNDAVESGKKRISA